MHKKSVLAYLKPISVGVCSLIYSLSFSQISIDKLLFEGEIVSEIVISVKRPNEKIESLTVTKASIFDSGTLFQIPLNTEVYLKTPGGNIQRLGPGAKHQVNADGQGENHKTFWGSVKHFVKNKLSFYKASGPTNKYQAAVKGTVFSVSVKDKNVEFSTSEGKVEIDKKIPLSIEESDAKNTSQPLNIFEISKTISKKGDTELFDYTKSNPNQISSYKKAIRKYTRKLKRNANSENYFALGRLYLLTKEYDLAIENLERAHRLSLNEPNPNYDISLNLVEAYYEIGRDIQAQNWLEHAFAQIETEYEFLSETFDHYAKIDDKNASWGFGIGLIEIYNKIGDFEAFLLKIKEHNASNNDNARFLQFIIEDEEQIIPQIWYNKADNLENYLKGI